MRAWMTVSCDSSDWWWGSLETPGSSCVSVFLLDPFPSNFAVVRADLHERAATSTLRRSSRRRLCGRSCCLGGRARSWWWRVTRRDSRWGWRPPGDDPDRPWCCRYTEAGYTPGRWAASAVWSRSPVATCGRSSPARGTTLSSPTWQQKGSTVMLTYKNQIRNALFPLIMHRILTRARARINTYSIYKHQGQTLT